MVPVKPRTIYKSCSSGPDNGYEWFQATALKRRGTRKGGLSLREELIGFFNHLETELDDCGFLHPPEKRPRMVRNIRNIFTVQISPTKK